MSMVQSIIHPHVVVDICIKVQHSTLGSITNNVKMFHFTHENTMVP